MNLADNLKRIRKENNLSQEQLAEQLGVSRQSVSKWESGLAYPEMDKMLQIAKLFNLNIDDLLNQNIKEVNNEKQSKQAINKSIEDFLSFISKTIDMFSSMKFKGKVKCLMEQFIIIGILTLLFLIIGEIGNSILTNFLSFLPWEAMYVIASIFESIYIVCALVLGLILLIHIFKTRYLDYYVIVKEKEEVIDKDTKEEVGEEPIHQREENTSKIYLEKKKEKIVIRDPKHSEYKFISGMLKCLLFIVKSVAVVLTVAFCISLITFVIIFIISFLFIKTGFVFWGAILFLAACISINLIVLSIIYNFIISKKNNRKIKSIAFVISLILVGTGIGLMSIGITKFKFVNNLDSKNYQESEIILPMSDTTFIHDFWYDKVDYVEADINDIKIVYKHSFVYEINASDDTEGYYLHLNFNNLDPIKLVRIFIKDFNNKEIVDYSKVEVKIYASKENIAKLLNNKDNYYNQNNLYQTALDEAYEENDRLQERVRELEEQINNLQYN